MIDFLVKVFTNPFTYGFICHDGKSTNKISAEVYDDLKKKLLANFIRTFCPFHLESAHLFYPRSTILDSFTHKFTPPHSWTKDFHRIILLCQARNTLTYHKVGMLFAVNGVKWDTKKH